MKQLSFNINGYTWVKLTPLGKKIYDDHWHKLLTAGGYVRDLKAPKLKTKKGWTEFQLWELMTVFGEHMYMGSENAFDLTIRFDENDLDPV
jgi:hypothetical protein